MSIASLYPSINPSLLLDFANSKVLDPRITFTRTTTATYYDGVTTAKAEENLLTYSQEFDNAAWSKTNTTVTANATTAPDGTSTAEALFETAVTNEFRVNQSCSATSGLNYTISVYVKANGRNYVALYDAQNSQGKYFDVTAGGGGSVQGNFVGAPVSASISYVGSDWYRCSMTVSNTSSSIAVRIYIANTATNVNYAGDVTKGLYLWGAQVEQRSSATAYIATTSQAITNYIPVLQTASAGQARFDHNPTTGESLGLLIEEARTNLLTYSNDLSNAAWAKDSCTVSSNVVIAPDGTLTGDKIVSASATAQTGVGGSSVTVTAADHTATFFVKQSEAQFVQILWTSSLSTNYANFDILNGTVTAGTYTSASITLVGNGWYRISITSTLSAATGRPYLWLINSGTSARSASYTGNGWNGIYVWGAQVETGSFATSYIPTVASSVTRNADAASMTGTNFSSWFNADLGSWYAEAATSSTVSNGRVLSVSLVSGSTDPLYSINYESNGTIRIYQVVNGSATYNFYPGNYSANAFSKIASCYKLGDYAGIVNAGSASTSSSQVRLPALSYLQIGALTSGSFFLNGTIKKISYYPIRVTNAQLQALTV